MIHPHTQLRWVDDDIGYGVFATAPMPMGTITWAQDPLDVLIDTRKLEPVDPELEGLLEKYTYVIGSGERLLCWDFTRYMNHSCAANTMSPGWPLEIAIRDIAAGEQLTSDYGSLNLERSFDCLCRAAPCRGVVHPDDFEALAEEWDELVARAFPFVPRVQQPLWSWLRDEQAILEAAADPVKIPSILCHRWVEAQSGRKLAAASGMRSYGH